MRAGRELDALVAQQVMGLTVRSITVIDGRGPHTDIGTVGASYRMADGRIGRPADRIPFYSTNFAAAWEVVEAMEADGWGHRHLFHSPGAENPGYYWTFMQPGHGPQSITEVHAETGPLAICLAALRAIGTEVPA